jgi:PPM family protein phosphatase
MNITGIYYLHEIGAKKNQEDYIWPMAGKASSNDRLFIVCDGVGGSDNGEIASRLIAEFIARRVKGFDSRQMSEELINQLLIEARVALMEFAQKNGLNEEMATTFSIIILYPDNAFIAWCGDTRVYHVRDGRIQFKTQDHSLVNTLVKEGEITEEEARQHPQKNIILRAIRADGSPIDAEAHWIQDIQPDDFFLLCTDGILENVSDGDIELLLSKKNIEKTDFAGAFQEYCFGKTRDNYSMYLFRTGLAASTGSAVSNSKKQLILIASILLIFVLLLVYISRKNIRNNLIIPKDSVLSSTIQNPKRDSLPYLEIVSDGEETDSALTADSLKRDSASRYGEKNIKAVKPDTTGEK